MLWVHSFSPLLYNFPPIQGEKMAAAAKSIGPAVGLTPCSICKKALTDDLIKRCSKCRDRIYCGPTCQAQDWKTHQSTCVEVPELITHLTQTSKI